MKKYIGLFFTALLITSSAQALPPDAGKAANEGLARGMGIGAGALTGSMTGIGKSVIRFGDALTAPMDYPPEEHPDKWNYIANKQKKCWIHKATREKVCK